MFIIKLIIKLSSVTYALKARELLSSHNIKSKIQKNPSPKRGEGCGYVLIVFNPKSDIISLLKSHSIPIKEAEWR